MAPISTTRPWYTYVTARELLLDAPVLPDALRTLLLDLPKLKKSIPKALRTAPPQRPLEFGSSADYSSADRIAHKLNFDKRERNTLIALLTAVAGVHAPSPCGMPACEKNFARCIVLSPALCEGLGETYHECCASCVINGNMTRCSLHPDYNPPKGSKAAAALQT